MDVNVTWIVDSSIAERIVYHRNIVDEVRRQGLRCIDVTFKVGAPIPIIEDVSGAVVLYGSHQFVKAINPTGRFQPGALGVSEQTQTICYMSNIPLDWFMNRDAVWTTWSQFKHRKDDWMAMFPGTKLFVRPNSGFKTFAGQCIKYESWDYDVKCIDELSSVMPETLIMVAPDSEIMGEFRFVIADRKVIAGSEYRWDGKLDIRRDWPPECEALAQQVAEYEWQVDIAYTCDVALTPDGAKLVELNGFSCAGLYACDVEKVVNGISEAAWREWSGDNVED